MPWKVDDSEMRKMHRKHLEMLTNVPAIMLTELDKAVNAEAWNHPYDNYTGDLEKSTRVDVISMGDPVEMDMAMDSTHDGKMDESYATIVQTAGRTNIEEERNKAIQRLNARFKVNG